MHAASVNPEPGSNSPSKRRPKALALSRYDSQSLSHSSVVKVRFAGSQKGARSTAVGRARTLYRAGRAPNLRLAARAAEGRVYAAGRVRRKGLQGPAAGH